MENNSTITSILGITHKNMAMLLRIPQSQWSMYESGRRNIPLEAKRMLAEMLAFLKLEDYGSDISKHLEKQEEAKRERLVRMLRENEDQLYVVTKKLTTMEKKYRNNIRTIELMEYLIRLADETFDRELLEIIASKASRAIQKTGLADLTALRMKEEALQLEKLVLGSALRKMTQNPERLTG